IPFACLMCPDFGAGRLEGLQAIDMISVVMADNDTGNGLVRRVSDGINHGLTQGRSAQGDKDQHAVGCHDEAGVGHEALVFLGSQAGRPPKKIGMGVHPLRYEGDSGYGQSRPRREEETDQSGTAGETDSGGWFQGFLPYREQTHKLMGINHYWRFLLSCYIKCLLI